MRLEGTKVAILVADGFEQIEMTSPRDALDREGAETFIISPNADKVRGWQHTEWGEWFDVDVPLHVANAADYDALLLPGGVMSPDKLRINEKAIRFVRGFFKEHKPVGAICHGPWTLIDANVVDRREITSYPSIQMDLKNAGAHWVDREVVVDEGLVSSRSPADLEAFNAKLIEEVAEGRHARQHT